MRFAAALETYGSTCAGIAIVMWPSPNKNSYIKPVLADERRLIALFMCALTAEGASSAADGKDWVHKSFYPI